MQSRARIAGQLVEKSIPIVVLAILVVGTYAFFRWLPYYGFFFDSAGIINNLYVSPSPLRLGDQLLQVGEVTWADFKADSTLSILPVVNPGEVVPIVVERQGRAVRFDYTVPEPTQGEFVNRLINNWPVPFAFWAAGTLTLLLARPKDNTWRLLIAFNYVSALWLTAGFLSNSHLFYSSILFHAFLFISVPVYLHLHLIFPTPLWPKARLLLWALYGLGGLLVVLEWVQWLPRNLYLYALLAAIVGSVALLIVRYVVRPAERSDLGFMIRGVGLAVLPAVVLVIYGIVTGITGPAGFSIVFLPGLPFAYAYGIYRRRLGQLEVRVNQAISIYAFCALLVLLALAAMPLIARYMNAGSETMLVNIVVAVLIMLITVLGFGPFQRFVERRILGVRIPPTQLLESYAAEITKTQNSTQLVRYLCDEISASLLVRQSALVRLEGGKLLPLYVAGVAEAQLPTDPSALDDLAGHYLPSLPEPAEGAPPFTAWLRLALPLSIETHPIGYWLLGRRDPDDYYSAKDISILTTVANQTAVALHNILQTERLHTLYQNDIDRGEDARASLARELHDQVLNELGLLWRSTSQSGQSAQMEESYERLSASVRRTITGLRPAAVDFGLRLAFADLVDRVGNNGTIPKVELVLGDSESDYQRHAPNVELHLYRIVQQAVTNAMQYAQATRITIWGTLHNELIDLHVDDDGQGFEMGDDPDITQLVARKHFGIAGMVERAHLIGARIRVQSGPGQGTHVQVVWTADGGHSEGKELDY